jgi:hypothetical protein
MMIDETQRNKQTNKMTGIKDLICLKILFFFSERYENCHLTVIDKFVFLITKKRKKEKKADDKC